MYNPMQSPAMHSSATESQASTTSTCPPPNDPSLYLPHELVESILILVPLRFPLDQIFDASYANLTKMHNDCAAAIAVVPRLPRAALKLFGPRLPNDFAKMMSLRSLFGVRDLEHLMANGFRFPPAPAFAAALCHNRADVLSWWIKTAKLDVPTYFDYEHWDHDPIKLAVSRRAWDALDWVGRTGTCRSLCSQALCMSELAQLVRLGGQREKQFVVLWIGARYCTVDDTDELVEAACSVGAIEVLQACVDGPDWRREPDDDRLDAMVKAAVFGRGPVVPVLEWMEAREWDLTRVADYAHEVGDHKVLEWCSGRRRFTRVCFL